LNDSDVLIVGAGPGGCSAAIFCAQNNLKVTLLDTEKISKPKPGESLHPGILPLFKQLGFLDQFLSANFLQYSGNWVKWQNAITHFQPFGEDNLEKWYGFQISRPYFDELLLEHVNKLGVNIIRSCKALNPIFSDKKQISGICTSKGKLLSSFVIDSSGGTHWLARKLGLCVQNYSPILIGHYGYVKGECPSRDNAPLISAENDGWIWTAKIKSQVYQWVRLFFQQPKKLKISSLVPTEYTGLKEISCHRGSNVTWRLVSKSSDKGYFIIGDAAFVLDPLSSHGIIKAVMSGMLAGYLITKIKQNVNDEEQALSYYNKWMSTWFYKDMQILKEMYSNHPYPPNWI
jgi:flavin-dependent dehydrogenase